MIEVYPFRMMDFGCFASTTDGLSGLLHNSEMTSVLQQNLQEMIDKQVPISVKINKYDRRTGEVAFSLTNKDAKDGTAPVAKEAAATNAAASEATETVETSELVVATTETPETQPATEPISASTTPDLEPFQFTISQPVHPQPEHKDGLTERMDRETADIQKFLETVIKSPLSTAAQQRLRELLQQNSIFRFTYTMQTVVDDFEADVGLQLITAIERVLNKTNN